MAPTPDTAGSSRKQMRRPAPRIVPAIPLALTRAPASARPLTPEDTVTEAVTAHDAEPQPAVEEIRPHTVEDPLTPQSKASAIASGENEARTPASSVGPSEELQDTRDSPTVVPDSLPQEQETATAATSPEHMVNGEATTTPGHLPPPQSEKLSAEAAPFEGTEARFRPSLTNVVSHNHRPSLDSIVFGAAQESPAIPSTPREPEVDGHAPPESFVRHPPEFVPPQFATPFYPGHVHHISNPQAQWPHPTLPVVVPESVPRQTREFNAQAYPGSAIYQGGPFIPRHPPATMNGVARSQSQSPTKVQMSDPKPSSDHGREPHTGPYQNGTHSLAQDSAPQSFGPTKFKEPFELAAYLTAQFGNPEFADFILRVRSPEMLPLLTIPVHGIVVARSRTIASAIRNISSKDSPAVLDVFLQDNDNFVSPEAMNEAIKVLYGSPLLSVESFLYGLGPFHPEADQGPSFNEARNRMSQAISYAAAGKVFQMQSMIERGVDITKALLRWDTLEQAVAFGLESSPYALDRRAHSTIFGNPSPAEYYATKLVEHDCLDFIAYNLPVGFNLYPIAPELRDVPRLPTTTERPTHNPRLSRIRFGDVPPEEELKADYATRVLSSILLSLPLGLLDRLFHHRVLFNQLGWTGVEKIMHDVIDERERRRQKALKGRVKSSEEDNGTRQQALVENLLWEERVVPSSKNSFGYTLSESRLADH